MFYSLCWIPEVLQFLADGKAAAAATAPAATSAFGVIWGEPICQQGLQRLLCLGSRRSRKLFGAHRAQKMAPVDGRFLKQSRLFRRFKGSAAKRELVCEFLEEIYHSISEPMPESHGDSLREEVTGDIIKALRFRKVRGRRPKVLSKLCKSKASSELRFLPPGSFSDYLGLLNARLPDDSKISLKLFSSAACHLQEC